MDIYVLIPLLSATVYLVLVLLVISFRPLDRVRKVFLWYLSAAMLWSFSSFLLHSNYFPEHTLLVNKFLSAIGALMVVTYFHFFAVLTNRARLRYLILAYSFTAFAFTSAMLGLIIKSSQIIGHVVYFEEGPLNLVFTFGYVLFMGFAVFYMIQKYRHSTEPMERNRITYLLFGFIILSIFSLTNFFEATSKYSFDHIGNALNALIIGYAILRYQLLNIQLVMRKGLVYLFLVGILIGITVSIVYFGTGFIQAQPVSATILIAAGIALLMVLMARPLMRMFEKWVDRLFYRKTYDYRRALLGFSSKMSNILNLDALAKEILPSITKALSINRASLLLQDSDSGDFNVQFAYPKAKDMVGGNLRFSADSSITAWLDKKSSPINPVQIGSIPEFRGLWQIEKEQLTKSDLGLLYPLKSRDKLIGILALGKKLSGGLYSHEDIELVASIANQAGIIIENAQLYTHAKIRANTDELTGLYNHRHFHERLEQEIARGSRFGSTFSLIMMDIDLFKAYNDIYGHLAGDQVLRRVGKYIESSIRSIDLAFRYGGEEFAIILPEARLDDAYKVAERIRKTIESKTSSRAMPITVSLGLANWPNDGVMKEEIIGRADVALYRAKQTGRNRACLSSDLMKPETPLIGTELEAKPKALSIIYALAATVDAKDSYTYGHSRKVSEYAVAIAEALKLPQDRITTIRAAGLLHDIGKIGIPDSILKKRAPLTDEEWKPIKAHPELGVEILRHVIDLVNCLPAILHHHEHINGSGYPAGLGGDSIPLEARILAIADAYDAMTSPRPYRERLSSDEAINELRRCAGTQFDTDLVEAFCKIVQKTEPKILGIKTETDIDTAD